MSKQEQHNIPFRGSGLGRAQKRSRQSCTGRQIGEVQMGSNQPS